MKLCIYFALILLVSAWQAYGASLYSPVTYAAGTLYSPSSERAKGYWESLLPSSSELGEQAVQPMVSLVPGLQQESSLDVALQGQEACTGGQYWNGASCVACPTGQFSFPASATCIATCPTGSYIVYPTQACSLCPVGTYQGKTGQRSCLDCTEGTYADAAGKTKCTDCAAGYVSPKKSSICTACGIGKIRDDANKDFCMDCPAGQSSTKGASVCTPCNPGYASNGGGDCYACGPGLYSTQNHETCASCPGGKFVNTPYADSLDDCQPCAKGTFAEAGGKECVPCDYGTYLPYEGGTSESQCKYCEKGTYAYLKGQDRCTTCVAGKYNDDFGSVSEAYCRACESGKYSHAGATTCIQCPKGTYTAVGQTTQDACVSCPAGTYNENLGGNSCRKCPSGSVSNVVGAVSSTICKICPEGTYSNLQGTMCMPCPLGTISKYPGASSREMCSKCRTGSYSDVLGATECKFCPIGSSSNVEGAENEQACQTCSPGTYGSVPGLSSCPSCAAGSFSLGGLQSCIDCSTGWYSTTGSSKCFVQSEHPYTEVAYQNTLLSEPFKIQGYDKCWITIDARTYIETSPDPTNKLDNLYILDSVTGAKLYTYQDSDVFDNGVAKEFKKLLPCRNPLVVSFETDGYAASEYWGFKIDIEVEEDVIPTFEPTPGPTSAISASVKHVVSIEFQGIALEDWNENPNLKVDLLNVLKRTVSWSYDVSLEIVSTADGVNRKLRVSDPNDTFGSQIESDPKSRERDSEDFKMSKYNNVGIKSSSVKSNVHVEVSTSGDYSIADILMTIQNSVVDDSFIIQLQQTGSFSQYNFDVSSAGIKPYEEPTPKEDESPKSDAVVLPDSFPDWGIVVIVVIAILALVSCLMWKFKIKCCSNNTFNGNTINSHNNKPQAIGVGDDAEI